MSDFQWATEKLNEGKKVRRKCWSSNSYAHADGTYLLYSDLTPMNYFLHFEATDWEIFEEFSFAKIQEGINAFREKNTEIPNRIRLHPNAIKKLNLIGSVNEIFGIQIEIDDSLKETEALVYFEEKKESLSDQIYTPMEGKLKLWIDVENAKEKIQNVKRRLEKVKGHDGRIEFKYAIKIFKEEFGDKLI